MRLLLPLYVILPSRESATGDRPGRQRTTLEIPAYTRVQSVYTEEFRLRDRRPIRREISVPMAHLIGAKLIAKTS